MKYCARCFEKRCNCDYYMVDIDYYIYPAIYELNRKGYRTNNCCSGHMNQGLLTTYISFFVDIDSDIDSDYFQFDTWGNRVKRNTIRPRREIEHLFKKKRTNKEELIKTINSELYKWAKSLPDLIDSPKNEKDFPEDYFSEEKCMNAQDPWMLLYPKSKPGLDVINDFFYGISTPTLSSILLVGKNNRIIKLEQLYGNGRKSDSLRSRLEDLMNLDPKLVQFGQNDDMCLKHIRIRDAVWTLSYCCGDYSFFISEDEIEDFLYENRQADIIAVFTYLFEILESRNVSLCIFSSSDISIVFTNKTEFAYQVSSEYSAFLAGNMDYEETEACRISTAKKEYFIFSNGSLVLRKEF